MKQLITTFIVGFLFAIGLGLSGMTQPHKVVGFLDIFGQWDPSLMFVMIGAIAVHSLAYLFIKKKELSHSCFLMVSPHKQRNNHSLSFRCHYVWCRLGSGRLLPRACPNKLGNSLFRYFIFCC